MSKPFVHLHLHTEYSIVDGLVRVVPLVDSVMKARMPAVAVTDQSNLFAMVKFYKAAESAGIQPIVGADVWVRARQRPGQRDGPATGGRGISTRNQARLRGAGRSQELPSRPSLA